MPSSLPAAALVSTCARPSWTMAGLAAALREYLVEAARQGGFQAEPATSWSGSRRPRCG